MTEKNKKIIKITALGLCAAVLTVAVLAFLAFPRTSRAGMQLETPSDPIKIETEFSDEAKDSGVDLLSATISKENYEEFGIMKTALSAQTITATVRSKGAVIETDTEWSSSWQDPSHEWASGKDVGTYIKLTPRASSGEGSHTVTVQCLQAFGEPIVITCTVKDSRQISEKALVHYLQEIDDVTIKYGDYACNFSSGYTTIPITFMNPQYDPLHGFLKYSMTSTKPYTIPLNVDCTIDTEPCLLFMHDVKDEFPSDVGNIYAVWGKTISSEDYRTDFTAVDVSSVIDPMTQIPYCMMFYEYNLCRKVASEGMPRGCYKSYTLQMFLEDYQKYGTDARNCQLFRLTFTFSFPELDREPVKKQTIICIGELLNVVADEVSIDNKTLYFGSES